VFAAAGRIEVGFWPNIVEGSRTPERGTAGRPGRVAGSTTWRLCRGALVLVKPATLIPRTRAGGRRIAICRSDRLGTDVTAVQRRRDGEVSPARRTSCTREFFRSGCPDSDTRTTPAISLRGEPSMRSRPRIGGRHVPRHPFLSVQRAWTLPTSACRLLKEGGAAVGRSGASRISVGDGVQPSLQTRDR
jgi:hypothetical protein